MKISILGTGCPKCKKMAEVAEKVASSMGVDYEIEKITDVAEIMEFGVMSTPALAIDDTVVMSGKVPSEDKMKELLSRESS